MLPHPHLTNKALAELCHRLAIETEAGIDILRTWQREAVSARGRIQPYFAHVHKAISKGESVSVALAETGGVFPPLFLELVQVGEETGTLGKVFHRLEAHYRRQVQAQRIFLSAIAWPVLELGLAIIVIGVLIYALGVIAGRTGQATDVLGFGLVGMRGLVIYANFLIAVGLCLAGVIIAVRRGMLWTRPLQHALIRLPIIGLALEKIALSRLAWALHLALNVQMDLRRVIPLVLRATGNHYYMSQGDRIVRGILAGQPMHVAFASTGAFPPSFIDVLAVAEESGRLVESMGRLSNRYEEEAEAAIKTLATVFGFFVALLVMGIIAMLIFRLAGFYIGTINDALKMAP